MCLKTVYCVPSDHQDQCTSFVAAYIYGNDILHEMFLVFLLGFRFCARCTARCMARCMSELQPWHHTWALFSPCCSGGSTASCSLLVSPGPLRCRTAARPGSREPPPARRWPGSTRPSLPPWAGHLWGQGGKKDGEWDVKVSWRDENTKSRGDGIQRGERKGRAGISEELRWWCPRRPDRNLRLAKN